MSNKPWSQLTEEQKERRRRQCRERAKTHPRPRKTGAQNRAYKYGCAVSDMVKILSRDRCDICGTRDPGNIKGWQVDHNHRTGEIRGLLCRRCNSFIIPVLENEAHLIAKARAYLANPPGIHGHAAQEQGGTVEQLPLLKAS